MLIRKIDLIRLANDCSTSWKGKKIYLSISNIANTPITVIKKVFKMNTELMIEFLVKKYIEKIAAQIPDKAFAYAKAKIPKFSKKVSKIKIIE